MKTFSTILSLTIIINFGFSQGVVEEWVQTYGGAESDGARSIRETLDGGYIIAGHTSSLGHGEHDVWLFKIDAFGTEEWSQTFGGIENDFAYSVEQTTDGGYIIAGYTDSFGNGGSDAWLLKTDVNGIEEWNQTYGTYGNDKAYCVQQTSDNGYVFVGTTLGGVGSDAWLLKTDVNGIEEWSQTYGEVVNDWDQGLSVQQTSDGGFILAGADSYSIDGVGDNNVLLIKTDSNGNQEWDRSYGEWGSDIAYSVQQTIDGGFIIGGQTRSYSDTYQGDVLLIKTDSNGDEEWIRTFGSTSADIAFSVQQTANGGYIVAGQTYQVNRGRDAWLIRVDVNGYEEWSQSLGGVYRDEVYCVQQTSDGGYILAGYTQSFGVQTLAAMIIKIAAVQTNIIITEIMNNPNAVGDVEGEWFELFNGGIQSVELGGWGIRDNGDDAHLISTSRFISPGEFLVFGSNANPSTNGGISIDYVYNNISLGNGSDELLLLDSHNGVHDSVAWDDGVTFPDPSGASMMLIDPGADNSMGSNWVISNTTFGLGDMGTPGQPNYFSDIALDLYVLDFDTTFIGDTTTLAITVINNGNAPLEIDSIYASTPEFTSSFTEVQVDQIMTLDISFEPTHFGPATGILSIVSNDFDERIVEVSLNGIGYYPVPNIVIDADHIDFGEVMDGQSRAEILYLYNTGEAILEVDTMFCLGSNFSVQPSEAQVESGGSYGINVMFAPDDEIQFQGELVILCNDPDVDTLSINLTGVGTQQMPVIHSSDTLLYFGEVVPSLTVNREITFYNMGMLNCEIREINIIGQGGFSSAFSDAIILPGDSVIAEFQFYTDDAISEAIAIASVYTTASGTFDIDLYAGPINPVAAFETSELPSDCSMAQNYPNPFNPSTTIRYGLPKISDVSLCIYDIFGREVLTIIHESQSAGWYTQQWNGINNSGNAVSTGMYFARLQAGEYSQVIKMVYLQ